MNNNSWLAPYVVLSVVVFIGSMLFLFSADRPKLVPHAVTVISFNPINRDHFYPTQVNYSDPTSCVNNFFNQFQAGNLDPDTLQEGIDRCFGLNSNNNDNTQIIPPQPQPPSGVTPRFV